MYLTAHHPVAPTQSPDPGVILAHEKTQALAAARHAKRRYPGPAGVVLADVITAWSHFGYRGDNNSATRRLITELMKP